MESGFLSSRRPHVAAIQIYYSSKIVLPRNRFVPIVLASGVLSFNLHGHHGHLLNGTWARIHDAQISPLVGCVHCFMIFGKVF